jgi:Leucine-rich repeat (LRR) protein
VEHTHQLSFAGWNEKQPKKQRNQLLSIKGLKELVGEELFFELHELDLDYNLIRDVDECGCFGSLTKLTAKKNLIRSVSFAFQFNKEF